MSAQRQDGHVEARKTALTRPDPADTLISELETPELEESTFLFIKLPSLWNFVMEAQAD